MSIKAGCGTWAISRQLVAGLGGLGVRQPLDADQLKRLPLGLPQAVHRPQNAAGVLAKESLLPGGAATPDSARAAAWGCSSKRPARSLSCQRMCTVGEGEGLGHGLGADLAQGPEQPGHRSTQQLVVLRVQRRLRRPLVTSQEERGDTTGAGGRPPVPTGHLTGPIP